MIIVLLSFPNLCHDSYMLQLIILSSRKYVSHVNSTSPLSHLCRGRASLTHHVPMVNGVHFVSHFAGAIGNITPADGPAYCSANIAMARVRGGLKDHYYFPVVVCCYLENVGPPQRCVFGLRY